MPAKIVSAFGHCPRVRQYNRLGMTPSSNNPFRNLQRPPSMTLMTAGSWHTSNHARGAEIWHTSKKSRRKMIYWSMMSRKTPSLKTPVRNLHRPTSITSRTRGSWLTFNHAKELKFSTQTKNDIKWWFMIPRLQSGTFNILQVWLQGWRVADTLLIMLEIWNLAQR